MMTTSTDMPARFGTKPGMNEQLRIAVRPGTVKRAVRVALVIGTALALINHYHELANGALTMRAMAQILLSYAVPYLVSTHGQVMGMRMK
jgi:hypothetical protein